MERRSVVFNIFDYFKLNRQNPMPTFCCGFVYYYVEKCWKIQNAKRKIQKTCFLGIRTMQRINKIATENANRRCIFLLIDSNYQTEKHYDRVSLVYILKLYYARKAQISCGWRWYAQLNKLTIVDEGYRKIKIQLLLEKGGKKENFHPRSFFYKSVCIEHFIMKNNKI